MTRRRSNPTPHPHPPTRCAMGPRSASVGPSPSPASVGPPDSARKGPVLRGNKGTRFHKPRGLRVSPGRYYLESVCPKLGLPSPVREHRFHVTRLWRFDYAWLEWKVALEVEGLVRPGMKSRHTTNVGYMGDMEKYNEAALDGWLLIRVVPSQLYSVGVEMIERALVVRGWKRG